jgi:hypothetical protein
VELHLYREAVNAGPESTAQENAAAGKKTAFYDTQTTETENLKNHVIFGTERTGHDPVKDR